jgi:hypothetical protein
VKNARGNGVFHETFTGIELRSCLVVGLLALGALGVAGTARAEDVPSSVEAHEVEGRAEAAYDQALAAYSAHDKQKALELMGESYALAPHPELLFNMARLRREVGQCDAALATYRSYLAGTTDDQSRAEATRAVQELDVECGSPKGRASYWTMPHVLGWAGVGGAVVAGVVATYFAGASQSAYDDARQLIQAEEHAPASTRKTWDKDGAAIEARGHRDAVFAGVFAGTAGALAVGGVLLLVFGRPANARERASVSLSVGPSAALLGLYGRF